MGKKMAGGVKKKKRNKNESFGHEVETQQRDHVLISIGSVLQNKTATFNTTWTAKRPGPPYLELWLAAGREWSHIQPMNASDTKWRPNSARRTHGRCVCVCVCGKWGIYGAANEGGAIVSRWSVAVDLSASAAIGAERRFEKSGGGGPSLSASRRFESLTVPFFFTFFLKKKKKVGQKNASEGIREFFFCVFLFFFKGNRPERKKNQPKRNKVIAVPLS